ncbi:MAG: hypothetical protein WCO66_04770 [Candidatus Absconditabacteria bacterium]
MRNSLVQTVPASSHLDTILTTHKIGNTAGILKNQPPKFNNIPLTFCSYISEGYKDIYGSGSQGIIFDTQAQIAYACAGDTFSLMRDGNWLPGHEKFLFSSLEEMLEKYPTPRDFHMDFVSYFKNLDPQEIYPELSPKQAKERSRFDHCMYSNYINGSGYNEIAFKKPTEISNIQVFSGKDDLLKILSK